MNETIAQCLIDNVQWPSACEQGAGVDEDTYATLRTFDGHLSGSVSAWERAIGQYTDVPDISTD